MSEIRVCENCGFHNKIENLECEGCGYDLSFIIPVDEDELEQKKDAPSTKSTDGEIVGYGIDADCEESPNCTTCNDKNTVGSINGNCLIASSGQEAIEIEDNLIIGRDGIAEPYLGSSTYVSRKHAIFEIDNGKIYVSDASTNGTFINGRRLEKLVRTEIHDKDKITFADISFEVKLNGN